MLVGAAVTDAEAELPLGDLDLLAPAVGEDQSSTATGTCGDRGGQSRSATSVGGQAGFCFVGGGVELVYATPSDNGFTVDVDDEAGEVRVTFTSDDHESRIDADYEDGQPRVRVREEAEDD